MIFKPLDRFSPFLILFVTIMKWYLRDPGGKRINEILEKKNKEGKEKKKREKKKKTYW